MADLVGLLLLLALLWRLGGRFGLRGRLLTKQSLQVLPVRLRHRLRLELGRQPAPDVLLSNDLRETDGVMKAAGETILGWWMKRRLDIP